MKGMASQTKRGRDCLVINLRLRSTWTTFVSNSRYHLENFMLFFLISPRGTPTYRYRTITGQSAAVVSFITRATVGGEASLPHADGLQPLTRPTQPTPLLSATFYFLHAAVSQREPWESSLIRWNYVSTNIYYPVRKQVVDYSFLFSFFSILNFFYPTPFLFTR